MKKLLLLFIFLFSFFVGRTQQFQFWSTENVIGDFNEHRSLVMELEDKWQSSVIYDHLDIGVKQRINEHWNLVPSVRFITKFLDNVSQCSNECSPRITINYIFENLKISPQFKYFVYDQSIGGELDTRYNIKIYRSFGTFLADNVIIGDYDRNQNRAYLGLFMNKRIIDINFYYMLDSVFNIRNTNVLGLKLFINL